jgi:hypothetical protein
LRLNKWFCFSFGSVRVFRLVRGWKSELGEFGFLVEPTPA